MHCDSVYDEIMLHETKEIAMRTDAPNSTSRVQKHREKLRKAGMKPVQIWVPDTTSKRFIAECERQSRLIAQSDDAMLHHVMDEALNEVDGWE